MKNKKKFYFLVATTTFSCGNMLYAATENKHSSLDTVTVTDTLTTLSSEDSIGGSQFRFSKDSDSLLTSLHSQRSVSLGQTIEKASGVQNNSFGPNNGLPQIRSLTDMRVKVNNNGLSVSGLSAISGHLPTAVQPALADSIDIYKSSAAVLYGGNAIGGAVNVNTSQIPHNRTDRAFTGEIEVSGGDNTTSDQIINLNGKVGQFAWHIDAMNSEISGYDISKDTSKADACYDDNNLWRMGKNGMGINSVLARACQRKVITDKRFNPNHYEFIKKEFFDAQQAGAEAIQKYKDKYGLDTLDGEYKELSALKWGSPFVLYKNKNQFEQLPPEQQKMVIEEKWGGYIVPNFNKLVINKDYKEGIEKDETYLKDIYDTVALEKGKIPNSHLHNQNISTGVSYIGEKGYLGLGLSHFTTDYGVPGFASLYSGTDFSKEVKAPVNIESTQKNVSVEGLYAPELKYIDSVKAKVNYLTADNSEYLGNTFADSLNAKQIQVRFEINHHLNDFTYGTIGFDVMRRKTDGSGADRFLPNTKTKQSGIFFIQNFNWDKVQATAGYRYEKIEHRSFFDDDYKPTQEQAKDKKFSKRLAEFNPQDYFININVEPNENLTLNARYSHSERAPDVNELFASNFHFATLTDDQGQPNLAKETAKTIELGAKVNFKDTQFGIDYFDTDYKNYIFLTNTGISRKELEVKDWVQTDNRIKGWEAEINKQIYTNNYGNWDIRLFADLVKNYPVVKNNRDGDYMPNMPTSRYGAGISWNKDKWKAGATLTHYTTQKYKTNTGWEVDLPDYNIVDAYVSYTAKQKANGKLELFLDARNLTNTKF